MAAVEAGRSEPSLRLALALAEALGMTVEALFGAASRLPTVNVEPLGTLGAPGSRVALAAVGGHLIAMPLGGDAGVRSGFSAAGGLVTGRPGVVRPLAPLRPTLVVAGCDPALPLLETPLAHLDPPIAFAWRSCSSEDALDLAAEGLVHAAGIHVRDGTTGGYNLSAALAHLGTGHGGILGFSAWRQGLVLRSDLAGQVTGVADVAALRLRLVNREPGSEARRLLDAAIAAAGLSLGDLDGDTTEVRGHLQVAAAIAGGLGDVGIASEPAALAYGLGFVPLTNERFDLVVTPGLADGPEVQALVRVLGSPWLHGQLANIPGYDATTCGERVEMVAVPG
ncbi:MAG: helix-turn-helix protein [Acidimicrobiaceae bacterium]|nr:helix-turn-helix protein [Acidimicrobiaceae bacterium]